MKNEIHPKYHPVVYVDTTASYELVTRSTKTSKETREIDGVEHFVIKVEISSASHPFYTGKQTYVDSAGRVEKFLKKYKRKASETTDDAPAKDAPAPDAPAPDAK
jgi:large subunit ribosomal protein L31